MAEQVKVAGICGSLRDDSLSRRALQIGLEGAAEVGAETELIDLRDYEMVFTVGKMSDEAVPEDVVRLRRKVQEASGLILATPEYHGSYSGIIKNALDLMGFDEVEGKMIGLLAVSGGAMGGLEAMNALRAVGRALHAWVIPEQAGVPKAWDAFADDGSLKDQKLAERVREVGRQTARFAWLHSSEKSKDFIKEWEAAVQNPGG
ncbi:MAG: NAD(P)H-dependent oxidoreductase [Euryarchaeota archaeon]|nr:NAD(P)H-dependent oxidoreductase [Euryarchaeota archaeon]